MSIVQNSTIYVKPGGTQDISRNLDAFYSFLGISGAVVPILLCIAYLSRQRQDRDRSMQLTSLSSEDQILGLLGTQMTVQRQYQ
jgi:hypothetical protein